jgi:hypothetical protein
MKPEFGKTIGLLSLTLLKAALKDMPSTFIK